MKREVAASKKARKPLPGAKGKKKSRLPLILRRLREKAGMTQQQLAEGAGLTQGAVSRIERGALRDVRSGTLRALAGVLGVPPDYLAGRSDELSPAEPTHFDPQLAECMAMVAMFPLDAANRVYGFIRAEEARLREQRGNEDAQRRNGGERDSRSSVPNE